MAKKTIPARVQVNPLSLADFCALANLLHLDVTDPRISGRCQDRISVSLAGSPYHRDGHTVTDDEWFLLRMLCCEPTG